MESAHLMAAAEKSARTEVLEICAHGVALMVQPLFLQRVLMTGNASLKDYKELGCTLPMWFVLLTPV